MSLNETPLAGRVHIGLFGRRNAGKSSLINALTGQEVAIVSPVAGTTTDPVSKTMELLPLGPVVFVDTPGLDDDTALGQKRMEKTLQQLEKIDIALMVVDATAGKGALETDLEARLRGQGVPCLTVLNKTDLLAEAPATGADTLPVSAATGVNIDALKERIAALRPEQAPKWIVGDLLAPGDVVVLVTPIDSAAPKGRLILPQQQTIRDFATSRAKALKDMDKRLPVKQRAGMPRAKMSRPSRGRRRSRAAASRMASSRARRPA